MAIAHTREADETPVSLGYDRIRFLKPVFLELFGRCFFHGSMHFASLFKTVEDLRLQQMSNSNVKLRLKRLDLLQTLWIDGLLRHYMD